MQKGVSEKIIKLLDFFSIKKEAFIFNDNFNVWVISVDYKDGFNKDSAIALEQVIHQIDLGDLFVKVEFNKDFSKLLENIKDEVNTVVNQAKYYNQPITLKPKNAFERRLAHIYIDKEYKVRHESVGEAEERQIVIYPK